MNGGQLHYWSSRSTSSLGGKICVNCRMRAGMVLILPCEHRICYACAPACNSAATSTCVVPGCLNRNSYAWRWL